LDSIRAASLWVLNQLASNPLRHATPISLYKPTGPTLPLPPQPHPQSGIPPQSYYPGLPYFPNTQQPYRPYSPYPGAPPPPTSSPNTIPYTNYPPSGSSTPQTPSSSLPPSRYNSPVPNRQNPYYTEPSPSPSLLSPGEIPPPDPYGSGSPYPTPQQTYPPPTYPPPTYPPQTYPPQTYPPQTYPPQTYPPQTYPQQPYPNYPQQPPPQQSYDVKVRTSAELQIPMQCIPGVIGRGGSIIQNIHRQTQASIKIAEQVNGQKYRVATITGTEPSVRNAVQLIQNRVAELSASPSVPQIQY